MGYKNRDIQREYQRVWIKKRRELFFQDKHCVKCGTEEELELDHIDPAKKWSHRIWSYSWANIMKEVAKCQVLCTECHDEKTKKDMGWIQKHGTATGYTNYYCRCDACKAAHNRANNEWRWRTGRRFPSGTTSDSKRFLEMLKGRKKAKTLVGVLE